MVRMYVQDEEFARALQDSISPEIRGSEATLHTQQPGQQNNPIYIIPDLHYTCTRRHSTMHSTVHSMMAWRPEDNHCDKFTDLYEEEEGREMK